MLYRDASYAQGEFDVYWYEKNLFGDVIAVYDSDGTKLVSYTYDAWGNCSEYSADTVPLSVAINPFRYRGYYYDSETGFYYLNSRYYDPAIGRFINADGLLAGNAGDLEGYNLFAYCFNDPINLTDGEGNWPKWLKKVVTAVVIVVAVAAVVVTGVGAVVGATISATAGAAIQATATATFVGGVVSGGFKTSGLSSLLQIGD